jgi:multidrug resistance efflux pump
MYSELQAALARGQPDNAHGASGWLVERVTRVTLITLAAAVASLSIAAAVLTVEITIPAAGIVEPASLAVVRAAATGVVATLRVSTGSQVRRGDTLGTLDAGAAREGVVELLARLEGLTIDTLLLRQSVSWERQDAEAAGQAAAARALRARALLRSRLIEFGLEDRSDSVLRDTSRGRNLTADLATADVLDAEAAVSAAKVRLQRVAGAELRLRRSRSSVEELLSTLRARQSNVARMPLVARDGGVVLTPSVERLIGASVSAGDVLVELGSPESWCVVLLLGEAAVSRVRVGNPVRFDLPALNGQRSAPLTGAVVSIAAAPNGVGPLPRTYEVVTSLPASELERLGSGAQIRRGFSVRARILSGTTSLGRALLQRVSGTSMETRVGGA